MNDVYLNANSINTQNFFNGNNTNPIQNNSCYIPYADYYPMMNFQQNPFLDYNPFQNINKAYNNQITNTKETKETTNSIMKVETDSEIIQGLSGNYLGETKDNDDEKNKKKEIEINLGQLIVDDKKLNDFPLTNLANINKYNISVPENILHKGEFLTAIKEKIEKEKEENESMKDDDMNEIAMDGEKEDSKDKKIVIPENYLINMNDDIKNKIKQMMNKKEYISCFNNYQQQQLILKNTIEILYNKCLDCIEEIKKSIRHRVKKEKIKNISNQLKSIIIFHNELRELFLSQNKDEKENNNSDNSEINNNVEDNYITYAQYYLQSRGGKTFKCEVCGMIFVNHQTLGGHMSQYHRNVSEKYKKQNIIRKQREGQRKLLDSVKEKLFQKYNLDYRALKKNDEKEKIKSFIKSHQKEYEVLRRKIYREKAIKDSE